MATHTGHDKVAVCGLFAATASGKKLPGIGLIKRNPLKPFPGIVTPDNMLLEYSIKGTHFKSEILYYCVFFTMFIYIKKLNTLTYMNIAYQDYFFSRLLEAELKGLDLIKTFLNTK